MIGRKIIVLMLSEILYRLKNFETQIAGVIGVFGADFGGNMQSRMQQELDQAVRTYANKKDIELNLIVRV